jgi:hypothetical protein
LGIRSECWFWFCFRRSTAPGKGVLFDREGGRGARRKRCIRKPPWRDVCRWLICDRDRMGHRTAVKRSFARVLAETTGDCRPESSDARTRCLAKSSLTRYIRPGIRYRRGDAIFEPGVPFSEVTSGSSSQARPPAGATGLRGQAAARGWHRRSCRRIWRPYARPFEKPCRVCCPGRIYFQISAENSHAKSKQSCVYSSWVFVYVNDGLWKMRQSHYYLQTKGGSRDPRWIKAPGYLWYL